MRNVSDHGKHGALPEWGLQWGLHVSSRTNHLQTAVGTPCELTYKLLVDYSGDSM